MRWYGISLLHDADVRVLILPWIETSTGLYKYYEAIARFTYQKYIPVRRYFFVNISNNF